MIGQCLHTIATSHGLAISLFLGGLMGGFTHCAGMCAPFMIAQTGTDLTIRKLGTTLLLPYHLGRMTTYVGLAVLVSSVVNLAFLFSGLKSLIAAPLLLTAAIIFLASAFPAIAALFPWIDRIRLATPFGFLSKHIARLTESRNPLSRYTLGILLGFMPCGLVVAALMAAATAPTLLQSALAMAAFTVGTMPALFLVTVGGSALKQTFPKAAQLLTQGAMVISSLWLFALAGLMIF